MQSCVCACIFEWVFVWAYMDQVKCSSLIVFSYPSVLSFSLSAVATETSPTHPRSLSQETGGCRLIAELLSESLGGISDSFTKQFKIVRFIFQHSTTHITLKPSLFDYMVLFIMQVRGHRNSSKNNPETAFKCVG